MEKIDYSDTEALLIELDRLTRVLRDVAVATAQLRGNFEKVSAQEKVILAASFNSIKGKSVTERDKLCRLDEGYQRHLDVVAEVRTNYFISFAKLEATKARMEYLKTKISLTQTLIKLK